jgi:hypothetical protein
MKIKTTKNIRVLADETDAEISIFCSYELWTKNLILRSSGIYTLGCADNKEHRFPT